jgi:glycosyltransferase involved in cell wall biosynthesis
MMATASSPEATKLNAGATRSAVPVLLVVRELGLGGIERDVTKLALGLDRRRYVPYVATYKPFGQRFEELTSAGIPILPLEFPSLLSPRAASAALQLRAFIRRHRVEIVHAFDPSSVFAVPLARFFRTPVVLSSQLGHRDLHDPRTRSQLKYVDRWSDVLVVNCEFLLNHLANDCGVPPTRIELCYNGVQTADFFPGPGVLPPEIRGATVVIGAISVLRPEKALHELQEAFAKVRTRHPGCKLLIVGNGPELPRLQECSTRLNLQDDCVLMPAVSAVAPMMRGIDIFVSCSHSEAFSNAILEAMACGCCVVGSRVGGTPELIGNDARGLLFHAGQVNDLADTLDRLIGNPGLRLELGQKAAEYARSELTIEKNVACMMTLYDRLLARKEAR